MYQDKFFDEKFPVDRMAVFLKEMAALAGQEAGLAATLELHFGDVQTVTMLAPDGVPRLSISVLLPREDDLRYSQTSLSDGMACTDAVGDTVCLWHADEGRYAMVRHIPLHVLHDEGSVFDAILDTADQARQWHACLHARLGPTH